MVTPPRHAVFLVQPVHVSRVVPDDHHIDDQRALGPHPEAEGPAEEVEVQVTGEVAHHVGHDEPDRQQDAGDPEVLPPVLAVPFGQSACRCLLWTRMGLLVSCHASALRRRSRGCNRADLASARSAGGRDEKARLALQLGGHFWLEPLEVPDDLPGLFGSCRSTWTRASWYQPYGLMGCNWVFCLRAATASSKRCRRIRTRPRPYQARSSSAPARTRGARRLRPRA